MSEQPATCEYTPDRLFPIFCRYVAATFINEWYAQKMQRFYRRLFPPLVVLWGFIFQRLNTDHTCDAYVGYINGQSQQLTKGKQYRSESTSAYCQARQRLPLALAESVLRQTAAGLRGELGEAGLWGGYWVNLIDGTTVLLMQANDALKQHYGAPSNQYGECHRPEMRGVGGFDLYSGAINDIVEGPYRMGEHALAAILVRRMGSGYVHMGDRNFGVYHMVQVIVAANCQAVLRLKVTQAKRLGQQHLQPGCDLAVSWGPSKMDTCEEDLPKPIVKGRLIYTRLEKAGFRPKDLYLFTTFLDREQFPVAKLVALYGQRWNVELDLRDVKTTLKMEILDGKSVEIVRKELILGLLAYNLIRALIGVAAHLHQRRPLELSFARCWRRIQSVMLALSPHASPVDWERDLEILLDRLARCLLPHRKRESFEPRAVWRLPCVFPQIKGSRDLARQAWLEQLTTKS